MSSNVKKAFSIFAIILCLGFIIFIIYNTISDGKLLNSFQYTKPLKSNLKRASEIKYNEYRSKEEQEEGSLMSNEWVLNHWYTDYDKSTVFFEDVDLVKVEKGEHQGTKLAEFITEYTKDLLKVDNVEIHGQHIIDSNTANFTMRSDDTYYFICCAVGKETGEGKMTVYHAEVVPYSNETE